MTDRAGLERITISNLRGSTQPFRLDFDSGKRLTIIYGANASGKSTICDAFEFVGKGRVGSIDKRGLGTTDPYWHSVGKKSGDILVELSADTRSWRATKGTKEVLVDPPDDRPRTEVLRRAQVVALIEATSGQRYTHIERFIDVLGVEASEKNLRDLIRELKKGRGEAVAAVAENEKALEDIWVEAGKIGDAWLPWAESESRADVTRLRLEIGAVEELEGAIASLQAAIARHDSALDAEEGARTALETAEESARDAAQAATADAPELTRLLSAGRAYLRKHGPQESCPLCASDENANDLEGRIDARLEALTKVEAAQEAVSAAQQGVDRRVGEVEAAREAIATAAAGLATAMESGEVPRGVPLPDEDPPVDAKTVTTWLTTHGDLSEAWRSARESREKAERRQGLVASALQRYRENAAAQHELDALLPRLEGALSVIEQERKAFTDGTLSAIAAEVGRLYEEIHPGEGLNKISLQLDPKARASLTLGSEFGGQSAPPQAYFSDSHLDTLSLCIFIALAKLDAPASTILVLDDVLTSSDEPHVDRAIELICRESVNFRHCIVTTHYKPWKHKLKWGWIEAGDFQFVELGGWTPANGLALISTLADTERLRALLAENPADVQLVCAKAGFVLEAALNFLTIQYECKVPRKAEDRYTLGDLLPAIDKKTRDALRVDHLTGKDSSGNPLYTTVQIGPVLDELTKIAVARNVFGAHFNAISFELLESDALVFGQTVLQLMDAITDPQVGWPKNRKSGEYWATAGKTRRMFPLERPT